MPQCAPRLMVQSRAASWFGFGSPGNEVPHEAATGLQLCAGGSRKCRAGAVRFLFVPLLTGRHSRRAKGSFL